MQQANKKYTAGYMVDMLQDKIYLGPHLLHKIHVLRYIVVFVPQEACMLHSSVIVQALRWVVETATQEK